MTGNLFEAMRINLIVIRSGQPDKLAKFYEMVGLPPFEYHRHGSGAWHYSTVLDGVVFEIYPLQNNQITADRSLRIGLEVKQLDMLIGQLAQCGVNICQIPMSTEWGRIAVIVDLDGRRIELKEKSAL